MNPPPPPTVFNLTNSDKIRLLACLQTERSFYQNLFFDKELSEGPREFYARHISDLQTRINSLLTFLNQ